ncbi:hypothetical protein ACQEU8_19830 [Streptomyces sp. CA-250714]|uniref:hypothetical protein n=1 Tax=Streptomyces sp. CA-250714 TaxID=3240060 RepID=UPI003D8DA9FB
MIDRPVGLSVSMVAVEASDVVTPLPRSWRVPRVEELAGVWVGEGSQPVPGSPRRAEQYTRQYEEHGSGARLRRNTAADFEINVGSSVTVCSCLWGQKYLHTVSMGLAADLVRLACGRTVRDSWGPTGPG